MKEQLLTPIDSDLIRQKQSICKISGILLKSKESTATMETKTIATVKTSQRRSCFLKYRHLKPGEFDTIYLQPSSNKNTCDKCNCVHQNMRLMPCILIDMLKVANAVIILECVVTQGPFCRQIRYTPTQTQTSKRQYMSATAPKIQKKKSW